MTTNMLTEAIALEVANRHARVESQAADHAVMVAGHKVNHLLHFLISVLTVGLWVFVWMLLAMEGGENRYVLTVDRNGNSVRRGRTGHFFEDLKSGQLTVGRGIAFVIRTIVFVTASLVLVVLIFMVFVRPPSPRPFSPPASRPAMHVKS